MNAALRLLILPLLWISTAHAQNYLANNTVLLVRHAEKPAGKAATGLTGQGQRRAQAYIRYFQPFTAGGLKLRVTALYAGADSAGSFRPRLTLEPLSQASGLPLNSAISTKDPEALAALLRSQPHGQVPLICWRHRQIPALLAALGVPPDTLLPQGKWPDDVYDWVLVLRFGSNGKPTATQLVHEAIPTP